MHSAALAGDAAPRADKTLDMTQPVRQAADNAQLTATNWLLFSPLFL